MHELLLFGQVPVTRHEQILKILAGVAAMQPRTYLERQLIYKPARRTEEVKPNKKYPNKPIKAQPSTYLQLVEELVEADFGKDRPLYSSMQNRNASTEASTTWIMKTQETPEPETKTLVLRSVEEVDLTDEAFQKTIEPTNHTFVAELVVEGHRFVHSNVIVTLYRLLRTSDLAQDAPSAVLPQLESLSPVDPSGALVLEARVRIDDRTKPGLVSAASEELNAFKELLRGSVELKVPERLSLDTRVR